MKYDYANLRDGFLNVLIAGRLGFYVREVPRNLKTDPVLYQLWRDDGGWSFPMHEVKEMAMEGLPDFEDELESAALIMKLVEKPFIIEYDGEMWNATLEDTHCQDYDLARTIAVCYAMWSDKNNNGTPLP